MQFKGAFILSEEYYVQENVKFTNNLDESHIDESVVNLENSVKALEKELFKCPQCKFTTESKHGLKIHIRRKHTKLEDLDYPYHCECCNSKEYDKMRLEIHLKSHSIQKLTYKCEDCDYFAPNELSMEVHAGRLHSGIFECGICGFVGNDSEKLENHLLTCELYKCNKCDLTFKTLTTLKPHLDDKHPRNMKHTEISHIQMDRKNFDLVSRCIRTAFYLF